MARRGRAARSLSVLLVEDTPANHRIISRILADRGHRVTVAENGEQALACFRHQTFDVVVMDVELPTMDGLQVATAMQQLDKLKSGRTPILMLTAAHLEPDRLAGAGLECYLTKPIDVARLISRIERAAEVGWPRSEALPTCSDHPADNDSAATFTVNIAATVRRLGGDFDLLEKFIDVFNEDSLQLIESLKMAAAAKDMRAVRRAAHALRGLASNFDAHELMETTYRIEHAPPDAQVPFQELSEAADEVDRVRNALQAYRGGCLT